MGPNDSLYAWARSEIGASAEGALKPIDLLEWALAGIALLTVVPSYYVFAERRFAATREVYQRLRRLREERTGSSIIRGP